MTAVSSKVMKGTPESTVLLFMIDALRHDVLNFPEAAFMRSLAAEGIQGITVPTFGFEPDAAYLAGLYPEQCDGGAQFWRRPGQRQFHFTRAFGLSERVLPGRSKRLARLGARAVAQWLAPKGSLIEKMATPALIPWSMLREFSTPMTRMQDQAGFTPTPTVFDILKMKGGSYYVHSAPAYRVKTAVVVDRYLAEEHGGNQFAFLFMGDLDGVGHSEGPGSPPWRRVLGQIDDGVQKIVNHARKNYANVTAVIFGDHGMVGVTESVDLTARVALAQQEGLIEAYFLDSTMARFWLRGEACRGRMLEIFGSEPRGHFLSDAERAEYRIRYSHSYFGEMIFAIDNACVVHPSFYSADAIPPKGMHGYLPGCADNESALVISGPKVTHAKSIGRVDMRRIFPTLLDLLGLDGGGLVPPDLTSVLN